MAAMVETMFYVREKPWHGLGTQVTEAPTSRTALKAAGLDWNVIQQDVFNSYGHKIEGYKANIRDSDMANLGIVSDRYKVVQNEDAFRFTDNLLQDGVVYETAGSLQSGKKVWLLARMPEKYIINGDEIEPFLLLMNSHDGSSGIKACMTPIRVVCNNTLNLAISTAKRIWTSKHTENIHDRLEEAHETFNFAQNYMANLGKVIDGLNRIKLSDKKVLDMMSDIVPVAEEMTAIQKKNAAAQLEDLKTRYFDAPDLKDVGKNAYRFINAVSDYATHAEPVRKTKNYKENNFLRVVEGNPLMDRAYQMVLAA